MTLTKREFERTNWKKNYRIQWITSKKDWFFLVYLMFACAISECWFFFLFLSFLSFLLRFVECLIENVRNFKRIESTKKIPPPFSIQNRSGEKNWKAKLTECIEKCHFSTNRFAYQFYIKAKLIYRNETRPHNIWMRVSVSVCLSVGMIFFIGNQMICVVLIVRWEWMNGWMKGEKWNMRKIQGN